MALTRWPREIVAINATSATAWIAFFYALQELEPSLVQVIWAGSGPLAIRRLERAGVRLVAPTRLGGARAVGPDRPGAGGRPGGSGRRARALGDRSWAGGFRCRAHVAERCGDQRQYLAVQAPARARRRARAPAVREVRRRRGGRTRLRAVGPGAEPSLWSSSALPHVALAAVMLIVLPLYLNQRGIALASPLTVRVVHAAGPVLVFALQFVDGRLPTSPWSLAVVIGYSASAALSATARQWRVAADARREKLAPSDDGVRARGGSGTPPARCSDTGDADAASWSH